MLNLKNMLATKKMRGIKKYTHQQRIGILNELVPLIKKKFGDNLVAIAGRGSTARNTDGPYSDVELFAFLKRMPRGEKGAYGQMRKIKNGLLVELFWITKETYLKEVKEVQKSWFGSGADLLLPILNEEFVDSINKFQPKNLEKKCYEQIVELWDHLQEATTKVLNAAETKDQKAMAIVFHDMFTNMMKVLAFINQTPFTSYAKLIPESENMKIKPKGFSELTQIATSGKFDNFDEIKTTVIAVFSDWESMLLEKGYKLYQDNIDPT